MGVPLNQHISLHTPTVYTHYMLFASSKHIPMSGDDNDCPFDSNYKVSGKGCNTYVIIIQDKEAYPEDPDVNLGENADVYLNQEDGWFKNDTSADGAFGKSGWRYIPDVFLSGSVHGNERVGPSSLLEMSELLVEAAYCESLPRMRLKPTRLVDDPENGASLNMSEEEEANRMWQKELESAKSCRQDLATNKGIPSPYRQWLARLVSTRRTVVIPTANSLGYSRDQREEAGIDPNRDFPFDIEKGNEDQCMQTTAGRSINELFRSHLFPIGLTFHGGTSSFLLFIEVHIIYYTCSLHSLLLFASSQVWKLSGMNGGHPHI